MRRGQDVRRTVYGCLTGKLFEHLGGTSESVTRLADGDVENQLLDLQLPHGVGGLVFRCGSLYDMVSLVFGARIRLFIENRVDGGRSIEESWQGDGRRERRGVDSPL